MENSELTPSVTNVTQESPRKARLPEHDWYETHGRGAMRRHTQPSARYGVEIRSMALHAEADDLAHIGKLLNGHGGRVRVFDRQSRSLLFDGTVEEVRKALGTATTLGTEDLRPEAGKT